MSGERKEKKEKYIHRWLREHPQIRLYLKREEYEWLKELADKRGVSVKNIILEAVKFIGSVKEFATMYYEQAWNTLLDTFIDDPYTFYGALMIRIQERKLSNFEPALFTVPCSRCSKPVLFTHRDSDWASKVKPILLEAFKDWAHLECIKKEKEKHKLK